MLTFVAVVAAVAADDGGDGRDDSWRYRWWTRSQILLFRLLSMH